jgi:SAM-dependent methyltransferase
MSFLRSLIDSQRRLSARFDMLLPADLRVDGYADFKTQFVVPYIRAGCKIYDIGGGKWPFFSRTEKALLGLRVTGVDISTEELGQAPSGSYDSAVVGDIANHEGEQDGDIAVCRTLLEHVRDTDAAIRGIASLLRRNGIALIFVPSRRALFARLNLVLPESWKRRLLSGIFVEAPQIQGFRSYYDRCTPEEIQHLCERHGLEVVDAKYYFYSPYFSFFVPLYVLWRGWIVCTRRLWGNHAAETFAYALRRL